MIKITQISPAVLGENAKSKFVNIYGLSTDNTVYFWDASSGKWIKYTDKDSAKRFAKKYTL
jgi:hypothetical protein